VSFVAVLCCVVQGIASDHFATRPRRDPRPEGFLCLEFIPFPVDLTVRESLPFRWSLPEVEWSPCRDHPGIKACRGCRGSIVEALPLMNPASGQGCLPFRRGSACGGFTLKPSGYPELLPFKPVGSGAEPAWCGSPSDAVCDPSMPWNSSGIAPVRFP
jgi:hypothetical protein